MSITYYASKVKEVSTVVGTGNFILTGAVTGYKKFVNGIGADKTLTYLINRSDSDFEWEIGVGYVSSAGGVDQLVRQRVLSSSNNNNLVSFTAGTKYVQTNIPDNLINNGLLNLEEKSASFSAPYAPATYLIDASSANVTISLPQVSIQNDPIVIGFVLSSTSGSQYQQTDAILLDAYGSETINGSTVNQSISILNDYLQLISVPSQTGWLKLDPVQDSTNPYGNDGYVQLKFSGSFSGVNKLVWDNTNSSLLIGDSGNATADIVLAPLASQTTIFNQRLYDKDFRVAGTGNSHLFYIDGGANNVGINTSTPTDILTINANSYSGIIVHKSGAGPRLLLGNTALSGLATNDTIGTIVFSGLNSANSPISYAKITAKVDSPTNSTETSYVSIGIMNAGSFEDAAVFSASGISLGFNNTNTDGTIIGGASSNEGNNVVLGYYNSVCGQDCVVAGDNLSISSGTFGGAIGSNHSVSGNNIWVFGGQNVSTSGNNKVYLATDNSNYFAILDSGNATITTSTNNDSIFSIKNKTILSSGVDQSFAFIFSNNIGVDKTGLLIVSQIDDVTSTSEDSSVKVKIISSGTQSDIMSLGYSNLNIGSNNNTSGNNTIFGYDNTISNSGNFVFGKNVSTTGNNNIIFGTDINCSGSNIHIFGRNNSCLSSGNANIVIFGEGNEVDEDYVTSIGIDNANSGLYSFTIGYMNGVHGDYSIGLGESNLILCNSSVAVGKNNSLSSTTASGSLFVAGVGNDGDVANTGFIMGYLNQLYGSGGYLFGSNLYSSGNNNLLLGTGITASGSNNIILSNNSSLSSNDSNTIQLYLDNNNYIRLASTGVSIKSSGSWTIDNIIVTNTGTIGSLVVNSGFLYNNIVTPTGSLHISSTLPTGTNSVSNIVYQTDTTNSSNNALRYELLAYSGAPVDTLQLTANDAEYQFLYPTGTTLVYLPNGTGLHMGRKFTIANMGGGYNITIRNSGSVSNLSRLTSGFNSSFVHAGNDNWIRLTPHDGSNFSEVEN